jgi:hypothetical protein
VAVVVVVVVVVVEHRAGRLVRGFEPGKGAEATGDLQGKEICMI